MRLACPHRPQLSCLACRGRPIYFGPLGKPAMDYFTGVGKALGSKRFETGDNPAEWLVGMTTSANE